jgi:hypothetical protein
MSKTLSIAVGVLVLGAAGGLWACANYYDQPEYAYLKSSPHRGYASAGERPAPAPGSEVSFIACPVRAAPDCVTARDGVGVVWDVTGAREVPQDYGKFAMRYRGRVGATSSCSGGPTVEDVTWVQSDQPCPQAP